MKTSDARQPAFAAASSGTANPNLTALVAALNRIAEQAKPIDPKVANRLSGLAGRLEAQTVSLAFVGRFSSGKSSVINCALGWPLLPASDLPETGIPCYLHQGSRDEVLVTARDGALRTTPCTTEAISRYVSMRTEDGDLNATVDDVERLDISLHGFAHAEMIWIDTPGGSAGGEGRLSEMVSLDADLVIWVLGSGQFLSESEAQGIARHVALCGPDSIAIVLNVRLPEHGISRGQAWQEAVARLPAWRKRMVDMWAEVGIDSNWSPPLILVSAREALHDPKDFGGPDFQDFLATVRAPAAQASIDLRVGRVRHEVELARDEVSALLSSTQEVNRKRIAELAAHEEVATRDRNRARRQVKDALATFSSGFAAGARAEGEELCNRIRSRKVSRSDDLSEALQDQLDDAARREMKALNRTLNGIEGLNNTADVNRKLQVASVTVEYANNPVQKGGASTAGGAALGAVIGTAILPGVGTVIGGALGGLFGKGRGDDQAMAAAIALDVKQTCETVTTEAARAAAVIKKASDDMVDRMMMTYTVKANSPKGPDKDLEAGLISLLNDLTALASRLPPAPTGQGTSERLAG